MFAQYDWLSRTTTYHRTQIREFFGFRENTVLDAEEMIDWLYKGILLHDHNYERLVKAVYQRFRDLKIEPPTPDRIERLINTAISQFEEHFFQATLKKLPAGSLPKMDTLVNSSEIPDEINEAQGGSNSDEIILTFNDLKADLGKPGVESALKEVRKLRTIRSLELPDNLFNGIPLKILYKYRQRSVTEYPRELRRHPEPVRYTLLSAFFYLRAMEITDSLIELAMRRHPALLILKNSALGIRI